MLGSNHHGVNSGSARAVRTRKEIGKDSPAILVVRFSSIGDVLLTTPVLRAIKARWPASRVSFLTKDTFAPLFAGNPHVDEVVSVAPEASATEIKYACLRLLNRRWRLLVDLHGSLRSRLVAR